MKKKKRGAAKRRESSSGAKQHPQNNERGVDADADLLPDDECTETRLFSHTNTHTHTYTFFRPYDKYSKHVACCLSLTAAGSHWM